jgi:hypothetical protein
MVSRKDVAVTAKILKLAGGSIAVPLHTEAARKCGLLAGSFVRVIILEHEIRVRKASLPRLEDSETYEQYRERIARAELDEQAQEDEEDNDH